MIKLVEVGPRDGLQNERVRVPTELKVALVDALSETGLTEIEASAFVSAKWVPQLSDASDLFARIRRRRGVFYSALVPNEIGMDRALVAKVDKIAVFTAASETFNRKNINATIEESLGRFKPVLLQAKGVGLPVRGYVSVAFWCPYEGRVAPEKTVEVTRRLVDLGVDEVSIGDTIGKASTEDVRRLLDLLLQHLPPNRVAMHFHNTYGHAIANVIAAWKKGIETFDSSVGGLGGCPYAPGAPGNVATEDVVRALRDAGAVVEVDLDALRHARNVAARAVGRPL